MTRRKTNEEFIKQVKELVGDEYTFLQEYKNRRTKIKVKHEVCGYTYEVAPGEFLRGSRCPKCSMKNRRKGYNRKKTDEEFKEEVLKLVGSEYTFIDKYRGYNTKLKVKHNTCNKVYSATPSVFLQGKRCPNCEPTARKTQKEFEREVYDLVGDEYTFIDNYKNTDTKIRVRHNDCGHVYSTKPDNFFLGNRCPSCRYENLSIKTRKTQEKFEEEVYELVGNEYVVIGRYTGNHKKVEFKHVECGNIYETTPDILLRGSRCPICSETKGEKRVSTHLSRLGLSYKTQQTFSDLKDSSFLRYDFSIRDSQGEVTHLIEYDGQHHFYSIDFFGGNKYFASIQRKDKMKNDYAKDNNIPLLRIPYWDFENIERLVDDFLKKYWVEVAGGVSNE